MCWKVKRKCKKHCVNYADCIDKDKGKKGKAYNCENYRNIPYMTNPVPMPPVKPPKPSFLTNRQWLERLNNEEYSHFIVATLKNEWATSNSQLAYEEYLEKWLQAEHKD